MKYDKIKSELFIKNRKNFMKNMVGKSIAFFNSNDIYPISADSTLAFEQHRDIFYLSGVDQEESILVLCPNAKDDKHKEILFLKETNDHIAVWEGPKLNKDQAFETSGVKTVYWLKDSEKIIAELVDQCNIIYYNHNEHYRAKVETETREERFNKWLKKTYPHKKSERSNPRSTKRGDIHHLSSINSFVITSFFNICPYSCTNIHPKILKQKIITHKMRKHIKK
jgi:Xaa-Pro aminopeptidase